MSGPGSNFMYEDFYKKGSKKFKKYEFFGQGELVGGDEPNFFQYVRKFANKNFIALDLGCGSGELTLKFSRLFKGVFGIDPFIGYIDSANKQKRKARIKNVTFSVADGKSLPFRDGYFDVIISSRGPLSSDVDFLRESFRVLKVGGLMVEETIGEKDKKELKKIFKRGQGFPIRGTKIGSVRRLLKQSGMKFVESKQFVFFQIYPSIESVVEVLERAPIIPCFDKLKDKKCVELVDKKLNRGGIMLSSHRLHWVAEKK